MIPITDTRMTRFWITLEEGVNFVINCISIMKGGEVFIPKLHSMSIVDLAKAIAPNCKQVRTGIRPGEKIHETLLTMDESRRALEFKDMYIIEPDFSWWKEGKHANGKRLPENFKYSSDTNKVWFSVDQLRKMLNGI
jgi:UDP-N-acetylglucosamine 4,6-dehydratase